MLLIDVELPSPSTLFTNILLIIYIPSKLVFPELMYNKLCPNNIIQEDNPPNKKYVKPAFVESSEFLYIVDNKYKP